ncbi:MAG: hypothetical protein WC635_12460 [Bacteriovorax sp.]|jgi:hypothetical protein
MKTFNLKKEIRTSKKNKRTTLELKKYFFTLTSSLLSNHYGENYSDRCLQASLGIKYLLSCAGIESFLVQGALCIPVIRKEHFEFGWQGFWDQDHHFWLITEFGEHIDLTIHQANIHPAFTGSKQHTPTPIWWNNFSNMPSVLKYLNLTIYPAKQSVELQEKEENEALQSFLANIKSKNTKFQREYTQSSFEKILSTSEDMILWENQKDPWLMGLRIYNDNPIEFPNWIVEKEAELQVKFGKTPFIP